MADYAAMFDAGMEVRPPLDDAQLGRIPARRGVVFLEADGGKPILMITAADMRARVRNRVKHAGRAEQSRMPDLGGITRRIRWKPAASPFEADLDFLDRAAAVWPQRLAEMVAWKPAWFVHVDRDAEVPAFQRTRAVFAEAGSYLGPFPDGRAADRFIEAVRDVFDLCREPRHLAAAPRAEPCTYAEIGRCLCPCDGSIPMDAYREVVGAAARFAAGDRGDREAELDRQMRAASEDLRFERAAALKSRLDSAAELRKPAYRHVAPAEAFQFLCFQRSGRTRGVRAFLADRGRVLPAGEIDYPPARDQLRALLGRMGERPGRETPTDEPARYRMGLVARQLFSSRERRGVILRWDASLRAQDLAAALNRNRDVLRVGEAKSRAGRGAGPSRSGPGETV